MRTQEIKAVLILRGYKVKVVHGIVFAIVVAWTGHTIERHAVPVRDIDTVHELERMV